MDKNSFLILDIIMLVCIVIALVNPSAWIKDPEQKKDPKELKKTRIAAIVFLVIELIFVLFSYVFRK